MSIIEEGDEPFLRVKKTEINFAIVPLFKGELLPKRIILDEPEFWAEKLADGKWNFSDLTQLPALHQLLHAKITGGKLHLVDERVQTAHRYRHIEFEDIRFELNRPFGKLFWPFGLSLALLQPEGKCTIKLSGIGNGSIDSWQQDHYVFKLNAANLDPMRLTSVLPSFPEIIGLIDLELNGSGVPVEDFSGTMAIKANKLTVMPPGLGPIKIADASTSAQVEFNKQRIIWHNLNIKLGPGEIRSDGKLDHWLSEQPTYEARLTGHFDELGKLLKHIDAEWVSTGLRSFPKNVSFEGFLACKGSVCAAPGKQVFDAAVALADGTVKLAGTPFVASAVNGVMNFDESGLDVKSLKGRLGKGQFQASGHLVPEKTINLSLESKLIQFEDIKALLDSLKLQSTLSTLPIRGNFLEANATVTGASTKPNISFVAKPGKLILTGAQHEESAVVQGGTLAFDGKRLQMDGLRGNIERGKFEVSGFADGDLQSAVDLSLKGEDLDLMKTTSALKTLGLNGAAVTAQPIAGKVKSIEARLTGNMKAPKLVASVAPADLVYSPVDPKHPIHLRNGKILCDNDKLIVENVAINSEKSDMTLSCRIEDLQTTPKVKHLVMSNAHLDLAELSNYLSGKNNPEQLRKLSTNFENWSQTSDWRGKLVGNVTVEAVRDGFKTTADGNLQSIQFQRFNKTVNLTSGTFATNKDGDVDLKDLNGSVGKSTFTINGKARNQSGDGAMSWQMQLDGKVSPQDITALFSQDQSSVQLRSNKPVKTTIALSQDGDLTRANFSADVDPDTLCMIRLGDNKIRKPKNQKLSVSGSASLQGSKLTIGTTTITVGPLPFQLAGMISQAADADTQADIKVWIHDPVPIGDMALVAQGPLVDVMRDSGPGQVRGGMHILGLAKNPTMRGRWHMMDCSLPKLGLANATGMIRYEATPQSDVDTQQTKLTFKFDTAKLQTLPITDIEAEAIIYEKSGQSTLVFDNFTGKIAKGTMTTSGSLDLFGNQRFALNTALKGLDIADAFVDTGGKKGDITGSADLEVKLEGELQPEENRIKSLSGSGQFHARRGRIAKLSQLQIKIEQGNLLESGILGFNMANVLSTVDPLENGEFNSANGHFTLNNGLVDFDQLIFNGEEMKLSATGQIDLIEKTLKFKTTGEIPKVVAQGGVGKVASLISINGIVDFVGAPFSTPNIPVVGSVSSKSTRRFQFDADAPLDHLELIDQSIRKSFKWVSNEKSDTAKQKR